MLATTIGVLALALSLARPVTSQNDRQRLATHITFFSHLSPLLEYAPSSPTDDAAEGWNVSLARHATNHSDSSVKWYGYGSSFELQGNSSQLELQWEGAGDDSPDNTYVQGGSTFYVAKFQRSGFAEPNTNVYNISVSTNASMGSFMEFDRGSIWSSVPAQSVQASIQKSLSKVLIH
jgi:hypothetical protein